MTLEFRSATREDASWIARQVLEALHWEMYVLPLTPEKWEAWRELSVLCGQEEVLYSYRHTTVALWGGEPVGCLVAYEGKDYARLRANTFGQLTCLQGTDSATMSDETQVGEWYIDSLAVSPESRGKGVGRQLLMLAVEQAQQRGVKASLLVDPKNKKAQDLYLSLGFERVGELFAFGQWFWKMQHV